MTQDPKGGDAAPDTTGDAVNQEVETQVQTNDVRKDTVQYATYKKNLDRLKKLERQFEELQGERDTLREKQLLDEGKKDDLIAELQKKNSELSNKYNEAVGSYAYKSVSTEVIDEAVKMGCTSTGLLMKAVEADLRHLNYGDDFTVDRNEVRALLERVKQEEPVLFNKPAPAVKTGIPKTPDLTSDKDDLGSMSIQDKARLLAQLNRETKNR